MFLPLVISIHVSMNHSIIFFCLIFFSLTCRFKKIIALLVKNNFPTVQQCKTEMDILVCLLTSYFLVKNQDFLITGAFLTAQTTK